MKDYNISKITINVEGVSELVCSGQLVVKNAEKIKADLLKFKVKTPKLLCLFRDVDDFDTSMVQLIEAFRIQQINNKVDLVFDYQLNPDLSVLLSRSGIINENN